MIQTNENIKVNRPAAFSDAVYRSVQKNIQRNNAVFMQMESVAASIGFTNSGYANRVAGERDGYVLLLTEEVSEMLSEAKKEYIARGGKIKPGDPADDEDLLQDIVMCALEQSLDKEEENRLPNVPAIKKDPLDIPLTLTFVNRSRTKGSGFAASAMPYNMLSKNASFFGAIAGAVAGLLKKGLSETAANSQIDSTTEAFKGIGSIILGRLITSGFVRLNENQCEILYVLRKYQGTERYPVERDVLEMDSINATGMSKSDFYKELEFLMEIGFLHEAENEGKYVLDEVIVFM